MLGAANKKTADSIQITCACGIPPPPQPQSRNTVLNWSVGPVGRLMLYFSMAVMYFVGGFVIVARCPWQCLFHATNMFY